MRQAASRNLRRIWHSADSHVCSWRSAIRISRSLARSLARRHRRTHSDDAQGRPKRIVRLPTDYQAFPSLSDSPFSRASTTLGCVSRHLRTQTCQDSIRRDVVSPIRDNCHPPSAKWPKSLPKTRMEGNEAEPAGWYHHRLLSQSRFRVKCTGGARLRRRHRVAYGDHPRACYRAPLRAVRIGKTDRGGCRSVETRASPKWAQDA